MTGALVARNRPDGNPSSIEAFHNHQCEKNMTTPPSAIARTTRLACLASGLASTNLLGVLPHQAAAQDGAATIEHSQKAQAGEVVYVPAFVCSRLKTELFRACHEMGDHVRIGAAAIQAVVPVTYRAFLPGPDGLNAMV